MKSNVSLGASPILGLAAIPILLFCSPTTFAQQPDDEWSISEIIVTATKRSEKKIKVPFSVQIFGKFKLDKSHIRDLDDLITFVPGASETIGTAIGQKIFQLRQTGGTRGDSTVGYYLDDIAFSIANGANAPIGRPFDLQRVEILKGPQSTLYGNGSMGGTIRYITTPPNLKKFEVHLRSGYSQSRGGDDGYYVDSAVNIPLVSDKLGLRVVINYERIGGYQEDLFGNSNVGKADILSGRAVLKFQPTDKLSLKLLYNQNVTEHDGGTLLTSLDPPVTTSLPGDFRDLNIELKAISGNYDLGFAGLSSTISWIDLKADDLANFPFPGAPDNTLEFVGDLNSKTWNNETRLQSTNGGDVHWLAGVFISGTDEAFDASFNFAVFPSSTILFSSDNWAVFGEVSVDLLDGKLKPLVGIRYFEDKRSVMDPANPAANNSDKFTSANPRFNLSYSADEDSNYYLNIAKGFRSGSFNNPSICNGVHVASGFPCTLSIDSDSIWSYEIGTKQKRGDVSFELAVYFQDWTNIRQDVPVSGLFQTYQFGDAEIYGVDLELSYTPDQISGLTFIVNGNINSDKFKNVEPILGGIINVSDGDQRPFTPKFTLSAMVDYEWSISNNLDGSANVSFRHISSQLGRFGTGASGDTRDLLRASIGIRGDNFGISLFVKNLLNEDGAIFSQTPTRGITAFTQDFPRQFGVELTYHFE